MDVFSSRKPLKKEINDVCSFANKHFYLHKEWVSWKGAAILHISMVIQKVDWLGVL